VETTILRAWAGPPESSPGHVRMPSGHMLQQDASGKIAPRLASAQHDRQTPLSMASRRGHHSSARDSHTQPWPDGPGASVTCHILLLATPSAGRLGGGMPLRLPRLGNHQWTPSVHC
jgi:hypothetical protein